LARSATRLKLGFFPLPESEARKIHSLLSFPFPCSVIDPCAGQGTAFSLITEGAQVERHGIELDTRRAEQAAASGILTIQGNVFDTHANVESFSLLHLNPPYDSEINLCGNRRLKRLFLEHTHHWLVQQGILVFVIPFEQITDCANILTANFEGIAAFRMIDPESVRFRQIVVFGVRRKLRGARLEESRRRMQSLARYDGYLSLPVLEASAIAPFVVPQSSEATLTYRGMPYNLLEDLLPKSAAWKQVSPILLPRKDTARGRPITPLHGGHVGRLCTAGLLNGVFGEGEERHVAR
jgi:hypothetical protein